MRTNNKEMSAISDTDAAITEIMSLVTPSVSEKIDFCAERILSFATFTEKYFKTNSEDIKAARRDMKKIVFFTIIKDRIVFDKRRMAAIKPTTTTCFSSSIVSRFKNLKTAVTRFPGDPLLIPVKDKEPITPIKSTPNKSSIASKRVVPVNNRRIFWSR